MKNKLANIIRYGTQHQIVRYIIGGGTSACVNLMSLYVLNSMVGLYYITASIIAFIISFFVSLAFHKFWTFQDHSMKGIHTQGILYLVNSLFGLGVNTVVLYVSVEVFHFFVLAGAIIAGIATACCTFFISKHIVFKKKTNEEVLDELL